jgi:MoaA/NifB/PqqE/SkfB family radical SAM enzyme
MTSLQTDLERQAQLKKSKLLVYEKFQRYDEKIANVESIAHIQIQYDTLCNMNCEHCCIPQELFIKDTTRVMTPSDVKNIFEQADEMGLARAGISGGEPMTFKDLDKVIEAINPTKFWIQLETNGLLMTEEKAKHYKDIGVDKIQLSIDSLYPEVHDAFRRKFGSWKRAIEAIKMIQDANLQIAINTFVTHTRLNSNEFLLFLKFCNDKGVYVNLCLNKPMGRWEGHTDELLTDKDLAYIIELSNTYNITDYINLSSFDRLPGCFPFRRLLTITKYGDMLPCAHLQFTVGNVFDTPLKDLIEKGMKYFEQYEPSCLASNTNFIENWIRKTLERTSPDIIENVLPLNWREIDNERNSH